MVFGGMGLLKNKNATCYPGFEDELHGAVITGEDVEVAENIITGKGVGVALKFALQIVDHFKGKEEADSLAKKMLLE
jgi:4-methyl-5(b-hydroxyethyl)-thiazole monophosphate biosynthesis